MNIKPEFTHQVCRTCLTQVVDFTTLDGNSKSAEIKLELSFCIPEMNLNLVKDPVLCLRCVDVLQSSYHFRKQCLYTEECIKNCINDKNMTGSLSLAELCKNLPEFDFKPEALGSRSYEAPKAVLESASCDIVDELNSLLDDALGVGSKLTYSVAMNRSSNENCNADTLMKTELKKEKGEIQHFPWSNKEYKSPENQLKLSNNKKSRRRQYNGIPLKQCSVKSDKLMHDKTKSNYFRTATSSKEKSFACKMCKVRTTTKGNLKRHINCHKKPTRPPFTVFTCNLCAYSTPQKCNLTRHMKVHSRIKLVASTRTTVKGLSKHARKKHMKTCDESNLFSCHLCKYKTTQMTFFESHLKNHTVPRQFSCKKCGFLTTERWRLKRHSIAHSTEKPFICDVCGFRTARKYSLAKHRNIHNKI